MGVTFDAKDGDVAQLVAVATTGTVTVRTRENGWSIEGPVSLNLDSMQAGGIINITEAEECVFTVDSVATTAPTFVFCYDGVCGSVTVGAADPTGAIASIKDDNGNGVLSGASGGGYDTLVYKITLPTGKSCDRLEARNVAPLATMTYVRKTVTKNNNGKQFKIARSFLKSTKLTSAAQADGTSFACELKSGTMVGACHDAVVNVDSILINDIGTGGTACDVIKASVDGASYPISRVVTGLVLSTDDGADTPAQDATQLTVTVATTAGTKAVAGTNCDYRLARHVITLDSAPVGSCSVAETTKGTYESYECSNRGACDGKSGLCTCYEGYSGQSCQTQTVLV